MRYCALGGKVFTYQAEGADVGGFDVSIGLALDRIGANEERQSVASAVTAESERKRKAPSLTVVDVDS